MGGVLNIAGQKFGRLTALRHEGGGRWTFRCDCGNEVVRLGTDVRLRTTKSCGCTKREAIIARNTTHGLTGHPLYVRYAGMIARCHRTTHAGYESYGGRGIVVCSRWRESFAAFLEDMGEPPTPKHTIDRIDVNGNYEPGNCRWATRAEQSRNTRRNVVIEHDGKRMTVRDWEAHLGLKKGSIQRRIDLGWDYIDAVTMPMQPGKPLRTRGPRCLTLSV